MLVCAVAAGAWLAGCDPTSVGDQQLTTFQYSEQTHGDTVTTSLDATSFGRRILFVGQTNTPTTCYLLEADLDANDFTLTLEVTARSQMSNCPGPIGTFTYTGAIDVRRSGTYHFVVQHSFTNSSWPTVTLTRDVVVN